jgi:hypothetical protein
VINQLRAFLLERGLVFGKSTAKLRERMPEILENAEEDLTQRMRRPQHTPKLAQMFLLRSGDDLTR